MPSRGRTGPGAATRKGRSAGRATDAARSKPQPATSGRYTPPIPRTYRSSPRWMGITILALLILGMLTIVLNYVSVLPASPTNWYLLLGLAFITTGFMVATRYR
ncbi:MAG: cell division protein CrgA [Acidimicrobiales bacterium]|nr:cell division protein CrgA [Actinomycetota bacterium]